MAKELHTPFRYDFVGSFLRPEALKKARLDFAAGTLDEAGLKAVEDETILDLIRKQKELGYHVITDGEFRRATWHLDFMWAFDGITHAPTKTGLPFAGEAAMIDDTWVIGKVKYKGHHPFLDHFRFVKAQEDENTVAKLTIPAPAQMYQQMMQNPMGLLSQRFNIPQDMDMRDPNAIIQHLLNTNQVSQAQVNQAMQMRNNPAIQMLMGGRR